MMKWWRKYYFLGINLPKKIFILDLNKKKPYISIFRNYNKNYSYSWKNIKILKLINKIKNKFLIYILRKKFLFNGYKYISKKLFTRNILKESVKLVLWLLKNMLKNKYLKN